MARRRSVATMESDAEALGLFHRGLTYKEIAERVSISFHTVNHCVERIFKKLQVRSRSEAILKYMKKS